MEEYKDKLNQLIKAIRQIKQLQGPQLPKLPLPKQPSLPAIKQQSTNPKISSGVGPDSKKDPKKVAEQIKNGSMSTKTQKVMLKFNQNGQWSMMKTNEEKTLETSPSKELFSPRAQPVSHIDHLNDNEQKDMLNGLNMSNLEPIKEGASNAAWANNKDHRLIVKNSMLHPNRVERGHIDTNSARREAIYHNMAKNFFDMGENVPTTAIFKKQGSNDEYSGQKEVKNASHLDTESQPNNAVKIINNNHSKALQHNYDNGDLHKISLMDNIMGNHDRHRRNYLIDDKGNNIHLIDNGAAFDYVNFDPNTISHAHSISKNILKHDHSRLNPEAEKWLMNLDPNKASELLNKYGHKPDSELTKGFTTRLKYLQDKVKSKDYDNIESLLQDSRVSSGPMHAHHTKDQS